MEGGRVPQVKLGVPFLHPSRDVKWEAAYSNLELRLKHRARAVNLGISSIQVTFKTF